MKIKTYGTTILLTIDASSKEKAKQLAAQVMENLDEMMGHAPFSCDLQLQDDWAEYEDEDLDD